MPCRAHAPGAALPRLAVNPPAARSAGPAVRTPATSGCPDSLIPAVTPAARNPVGAVTLTVLPPLASGAPEGTTFPRRSCSVSRSPPGRLLGAPLARGSWGDPAGGQAGRFRQAEHAVGVLDGLAGGALAEVVDRRPPGAPAV